MIRLQETHQTSEFNPVRAKHLLLVEDNPAHARLFTTQFGVIASNTTIDWVENGEQALDYLRQEGEYRYYPRPDLILLDLKMPRMDGHELLCRLKGHEEYRSIPTVIFTTSKNEDDMRRAYRAGANGYLVKPFDLDELARIIDSLTAYWFVCNQVPAV